jgi:hypothetical protein
MDGHFESMLSGILIESAGGDIYEKMRNGTQC